MRGVILSGYLSAVGRRAVCCPGGVGRLVKGLQSNGRARTRRQRAIITVDRLVRCCGNVFAALDSYTSHRLRRIAFEHTAVSIPRLVTATKGCFHGICGKGGTRVSFGVRLLRKQVANS